MAMPWKNIPNKNLWNEEHTTEVDALEPGASLHWKIQATRHEPFVHFDPEVCILELKGRSVPEDSFGFYRPLLARIKQYVETFETGLVVNIHLDYFNTSSSRNLLDVMHHLETMHAASRPVVVNWIVDEEDDDLFHAGVDFSSIIKVPFVLFSCSEDGNLTLVPESDWKGWVQ